MFAQKKKESKEKSEPKVTTTRPESFVSREKTNNTLFCFGVAGYTTLLREKENVAGISFSSPLKEEFGAKI